VEDIRGAIAAVPEVVKEDGKRPEPNIQILHVAV